MDIKASIDYATEYQLWQMFHRFYPEQPTERASDFAREVLSQGKKNVSLAQVQGYFMFYKSEPELAMANVDKLWTL